ncbi:hypothetical protein [Parafilimonas terrae]|uniref:Uncharacterized protein n=1 Tax=Parafilimonas terrae TaxID=1465490 RepID=A0A1I5XDR6_9BACT|nr:hypothetical protein [Parafilimonas terrae]SFQ30100.1 hypothetical protein SAMN05444277_108116 [Parafilimonas terrae]
MKRAADKPVHPKREFRKELAAKLAPVLGELKGLINEEEFQNRLKKAVKMLTQGLHGKDFLKQAKPVEEKIKQAPLQIKTVHKKAKALKKAAVKKKA